MIKNYERFVEEVNKCLKDRGSNSMVRLNGEFIVETRFLNRFSIDFIKSVCKSSANRTATAVIDVVNGGCRLCLDCINCKDCEKCFCCRDCVKCISCDFCDYCTRCVDCMGISRYSGSEGTGRIRPSMLY